MFGKIARRASLRLGVTLLSLLSLSVISNVEYDMRYIFDVIFQFERFFSCGFFCVADTADRNFAVTF